MLYHIRYCNGHSNALKLIKLTQTVSVYKNIDKIIPVLTGRRGLIVAEEGSLEI